MLMDPPSMGSDTEIALFADPAGNGIGLVKSG